MKKLEQAYDTQNAICARIILNEPERYPGIMQTWALELLMRLERESTEPYPLLQRAVGEHAA